ARWLENRRQQRGRCAPVMADGPRENRDSQKTVAWNLPEFERGVQLHDLLWRQQPDIETTGQHDESGRLFQLFSGEHGGLQRFASDDWAMIGEDDGMMLCRLGANQWHDVG